jgi:hypothetical protein
MNQNRLPWLLFGASIMVACVGCASPAFRFPINYQAIVVRSIPLAITWAAIVAVSFWRHGKGGLWLLLGAPMALYWPFWLLINGFPLCYYKGGCA